MSVQRVVIIGCGYVGSGVGAALAARGLDVVGTTTTPAREAELAAQGIRPTVVEVRDAARLHDLLGDRDAVYLTVAAGGRQQDYRAVYLEGARRLVEALGGTTVRRVIYTSSTSVYGQQDGQWVDEDSPTEPSSENGQVLVEAERTLLKGAGALGIAATVVRLAGIIGPGRGPGNRVARFAGQERDDGETYVNLIHRDDIVTALLRLLDVPHHGVLNLASDEPIRRRELYDRLVAEAGLASIRWRSGPVPRALGKRVRNDRIKQLLGLALTHPKL